MLLIQNKYIDDVLEYAIAANKFGIHGIHFTNIDDVKKKVFSLLNNKSLQQLIYKRRKNEKYY